MGKLPPKNGQQRKKIQNTLLVDGNALFKTAFFGAKNAYNQHGQHIGGLYQFMTTLRMLLTEETYHRVYVFWDGNFSGLLRYQIYEDYKKDRGKDFINGTQPIDQSELSQRVRVWEYLNEMYIRQLKHPIIEGDDFIAYYCLNKKPNEKITICTNDRDMAQLVTENVRIYFLDLKKYVDNVNFSSYFCYIKNNARLVKTICGDDSDSIKGIKGIKEKTLLNNFPEIGERTVTIDEVIASAKNQLTERKEKKLKPLKVLENIVNRTTEGIQGEQIFEINHLLVDLSNPMMTEDGIEDLKDLMEGTLHDGGRDLKRVLEYMKIDGMDKAIGEHRYPDYLVPFKELIQREQIEF